MSMTKTKPDFQLVILNIDWTRVVRCIVIINVVHVNKSVTSATERGKLAMEESPSCRDAKEMTDSVHLCPAGHYGTSPGLWFLVQIEVISLDGDVSISFGVLSICLLFLALQQFFHQCCKTHSTWRGLFVQIEL